MILLLPGNARALLRTIKPQPTAYGWLLTWHRTMTRTTGGLHGLKYAIDNECYSQSFQPDRFTGAIQRIVEAHGAESCLFVVAPDVVGNARATLAMFARWEPLIHSRQLPVALAAQDGLERLQVPWDDLDALFIGGTTSWKLSHYAARLIHEARERGKWTHVGRVNSVAKAKSLAEPPHSVDGTAWAKHPAHYAAQWQTWLDTRHLQPLLI